MAVGLLPGVGRGSCSVFLAKFVSLLCFSPEADQPLTSTKYCWHLRRDENE
jgi:hypothetical protein